MTLSELCTEKGTTLATIALQCGVSPRLLRNVDERRQPLPIVVAKRMALALGVELWAIIQAASSTTTQYQSRALNPVPYRPVHFLSQQVTAPAVSNVDGVST